MAVLATQIQVPANECKRTLLVMIKSSLLPVVAVVATTAAVASDAGVNILLPVAGRTLGWGAGKIVLAMATYTSKPVMFSH